jgi:hypothetical protein
MGIDLDDIIGGSVLVVSRHQARALTTPSGTFGRLVVF